MEGTLTVQNIEGPSSGSNANKIIIPSGQTLVAPGHVINQTRSTSSTQGLVTTSSYTSVWSPSYTPVSDSSIVYATFKLTLKTSRNFVSDTRGKYKIFLGATEISYNAYIGLYDYGWSGLWDNLVYNELTR